MHSFWKNSTGARDYKQIRDEPGPSNTSSERTGGALRFLVRDAQNRTALDREVVKNELPDIQQQIATTIESAQTIRQNGVYNDHHISAFIAQVNEVKTWIDGHKDALDVSKREYEDLRRGYRDARNILEKHQGTRFDGSSLLTGLDMSGLAASGMQVTSREMIIMKQAVVDQAISFLEQADAKLRSWSSPPERQPQEESSLDDGNSRHSSTDSRHSLGPRVEDYVYKHDRPYSPPPPER